MNGRMLTLVAAAALALAACDSNNPAALPPAEDPPPPVQPLGLVLEEAVTVMSADATKHLVRVSDLHSTVTLNSLDFDEDTGELLAFSITFGLPDGSTVTIDEEDGPGPVGGLVSMGDDGVGIRLIANNSDGDNVGILIGLGLDPFAGDPSDKDIADDALFMLARIDRDGDHPLGHDTYMVTGNETGTLPAEGTAVYTGVTIATLIKNGFEEDDHLTGNATITAHFLAESVDIHLRGDDGDDISYDLFANDLSIDGSQYGGEIEGTLEDGWKDADLAGDLLGAFYGEDAEATAGVFAAEGTRSSLFGGDTDYELVGGYAGYEEDQDAVEQ